jgi:hypothetical protein
MRYKKFGLLSLAFSLLFALPWGFHKITQGFHPARLHPHLPYRPQWETPLPSQEQCAEISAALQQTFTFLDLGSQTHVFVSADGRYVLKLFRYNRSRFPWIHACKHRLHGNRRYKLALFPKIDKTLQSYAMAYREIPEWTQLLWVHLNLTHPSDMKIHLVDPIGRHWKLPLASYRFALQRRAEPLQTALLQAMQDAQNPHAVEEIIASLSALLRDRARKQIRNSDHNLWPNFGVLEGRVVEIDCGNYRICPDLANPAQEQEEIDRFLRPLYIWLRKTL